MFSLLSLPLGITGFGQAAPQPVQYKLDLSNPSSHLVQVTMTVPNAVAGTEFQFPAWSNLYQIRDFVRDVQHVEADCGDHPAPLKQLDVNTWRSVEPCRRLNLHYAVFANSDGPFSAALNSHHAFLNFALLLFYLPQRRAAPVRVSFLLLADWKLATMLDDADAPGEYQAANYDRLADSPAEAGNFQEYDYTQSSAKCRVIVDAEPNVYSMKNLKVLEKITATETALMHDVPFSRYTFIYHFPLAGEGGGMEHWNGAVINVPADRVEGNVESISAHEFFHLWNVKRIRPKGLEPIDYIHGNDTSDLWFSEGVTSTYGELALLRAGLIGRKEFYAHLAAQISELEHRPARRFQSVAEAGREAWLEKYSDYFLPNRSISYYNKGELLGYLLDLAIRHATGGQHSLDDVMRRLNQDFAQKHRYFDDADLEQVITEIAPGFTGCHEFFRDYVDGTRDLDYQIYLSYAGLRLTTRTAQVADPGFQALQPFVGPVRVETVNPGSSADAAGLKTGDILLKLDGRNLNLSPEEQLVRTRPGQQVTFTVQRGKKIFEVSFALGTQNTTVYTVAEMESASREQLELRKEWLKGKTQPRPAAGN